MNEVPGSAPPDEAPARQVPAGKTSQEESVRRLVYFAAERTLMAWIRSSLALMALGFVIDRFGLCSTSFRCGTASRR